MALFLITSALVLPAIAVLSYQFLRGNLTTTEKNRFLAIREPEPDYWSDAAAAYPVKPTSDVARSANERRAAGKGDGR